MEIKTIEEITTTIEEEKDDDFAVVFYNDDVTPFVYVIYLLMTIFEYSFGKSLDLTTQIDGNGEGVVFVSDMKTSYEKLELIDAENDKCGMLLQAEVRKM